MSRWIDADALEYDTEWSEYHDGFTSYSQMAIDTAPSIDIVRCKECKWRREYRYPRGVQYYCDLNCRVEDLDGTESDLWFYVRDDDFCSRGERRE